jgi:hypothetical protein
MGGDVLRVYVQLPEGAFSSFTIIIFELSGKVLRKFQMTVVLS